MLIGKAFKIVKNIVKCLKGKYDDLSTTYERIGGLADKLIMMEIRKISQYS